MFEVPELITLARQANETIQEKTIQEGHLGNSPHKFVWYNRKPEEFTDLTRGKTVGEAYVKGRWLFMPLEPGFLLVLGECGGKILYHPAGMELPKKYHLLLAFEDGSALTTLTQMWGAMELFEAGQAMACLNNLLLGILLSKKKYRTIPAARRYYSAHPVEALNLFLRL